MVATQSPPTHFQGSQEPLTEGRFWALIALLDWSKTGDEEAIAAPLVVALAAMPAEYIYKFQDIVAEKLWRLRPTHLLRWAMMPAKLFQRTIFYMTGVM